MTNNQIIAELTRIWHSPHLDLSLKGSLGEVIKALNCSEKPTGWTPCTEPPKDRRNVFLAHGTNNFKSCCIGHYEQGIGWYEDRNFFATPIYDCKYWCEIPELPNMGESQFEQPYKGGDEE